MRNARMKTAKGYEYSEETTTTALNSIAAMPTPSRSPPMKSPLSKSGGEASPRSQSTPIKGSKEWLQAKRDWWKSSQRQKLVEYPSNEGKEIQKAQHALNFLSDIQTGKADASILQNISHAPQGDETECLETSMQGKQDRYRLVAFYEKYNPSKLSIVDETLQKYCGKEEELFQKLEAKYANDPYLPATGSGPQCFMEFSTGDRIVFELFRDKAPFTTENFRSLCAGDRGASYRNCIVHRIVPHFCIQAGDYTKGDGTGGRSIFTQSSPANPKTDMWGNFEDETPFLRHDSAGLLSMANNGRNRNSSQFFITLKPLAHLNGKHVVFGRVLQGMDVVEKLSRLETNATTQRPVELLQIVDCGEIGAGETDANFSHASNPNPLPAYPEKGLSFSSPSKDRGFAKTPALTLPVNLPGTGFLCTQKGTQLPF